MRCVLCHLAVEIICELVGKERFASISILDPACGTGGFLKTYVHSLHILLAERYSHKWKDKEKLKQQTKERLKQICDKNVHGIDFNPVLVRAAQMNLVMHGDGSSNIYHENALLSCGEWKERTRTDIKDGSLDVIITNPPFGKDLAIDDSHVLGQYDLTTFEASAPRSSIAPQELFVERCYRLLKPNGLIAVVSPDNIVSNPSYKFIRRWLFLKFQIIASISLPGEMFQPSTGTATTLLVMRRRITPFSDFDSLKASKAPEPIFMSSPRKIGHDQRGNVIPRRDENGNIILKETRRIKILRTVEGVWKEEFVDVSEIVPYDDLPDVLSDFKEWHTANKPIL